MGGAGARTVVGKVDRVKTLVIVATYNECENVEPLSAEILSSPIHADLLIVDDNSPDGTGRLADRIASQWERVHVIHRPGKMGLGGASVTGLRYAIDHGYDLAIVMDADFSHHPRYLGDLVGGMTDFDVTIGSRYVEGGSVVNWPLGRRLMSRSANAAARLSLGLRVRDCTGAFRCYRLEKMRTGVLDGMSSSGYSYLEEILYRCQSEAGMKLGEVPIVFEERRRGRSKISWKEVLSGVRLIGCLALGRLLGRTGGAPID